MKSNVLLPAVIVAFVVSAGACFWLIQTYAPGMSPISMFMEANVLTKLCMLLAILVFLPAVIGALIPARPMAHVGAGVAVVFGVLGALYSEMITQAAIRATGTVRFDITAPSRAESLFCLSLGLFVAVVALGLLKLRSR